MGTDICTHPRPSPDLSSHPHSYPCNSPAATIPADNCLHPHLHQRLKSKISICNNRFHAGKLPSPSNAAMLNGLYGKIHKEIQPTIAEIDNMGDIRWLSSHSMTVFIAFSHSRVRSMLSVTATAALPQSSVTGPAVLLWMLSPSPQLLRCLP